MNPGFLAEWNRHLQVITFLAPLGCLEAIAMASVAMDWNDIHTANLQRNGIMHKAIKQKEVKGKGHRWINERNGT